MELSVRSYKKTVAIKLVQILVLIFSIFGIWITIELSVFGRIRIDDFAIAASSIGTLLGGISAFFGVCIAALALEHWKEKATHNIHYNWISDALSSLMQVNRNYQMIIIQLTKPQNDKIEGLYKSYCESVQNLEILLNRIGRSHPDTTNGYLIIQTKHDLANIIKEYKQDTLDIFNLVKNEYFESSRKIFAKTEAKLNSLNEQYR
jgi:BMFP domain-containing protein YqiC